MEVFVFRTDLKTRKKVKTIKPVFNNHPVISRWSVDTDDIDNVLRIEASGDLSEAEVINMVRLKGFYCEVLPD